MDLFLIPGSIFKMQNRSLFWKMTYIFFLVKFMFIWASIRGSSHEAEGYRLTGDTIDQTKESAENYGVSFSVDCVYNETYPHTSSLHLSPRYGPSERRTAIHLPTAGLFLARHLGASEAAVEDVSWEQI